MLDIKKTAEALERLIIERESQIALPAQDPEIGTDHLKWMCRQVYNEWVRSPAAEQWVGYVQGAIRVSGAVELKELMFIAEMIESNDSKD